MQDMIQAEDTRTVSDRELIHKPRDSSNGPNHMVQMVHMVHDSDKKQRAANPLNKTGWASTARMVSRLVTRLAETRSSVACRYTQ
jgi:hypothetical protein